MWRWPGGASWAALGLICLAFGPSGCLFPGQGAAGGQKEASGVDFGSHLGSNGVVFNDLLGSPRGVFFITLSNLFLQQNCSENRDQRVLRVKSAQHGNTIKHNSFFQDFRSSQDRRAHSKQAHREETNVLKTIINKQGKQAQNLIFRPFRLALQTYPQNGVPEPPREPPGTAPGASRRPQEAPRAAQDGPKSPEYKSYPRERASYP